MAAVLALWARLWPVDKVILAYFGFAVVVIAGWWGSMPEAPWLLALHILGAALLFYEILRPNVTTWFFRHWYPLIYVASCYKEMAMFIPAVRHTVCRRVAGRRGSLRLACQSQRLAGAHREPRVNGIFADRVHAICAGGPADSFPALAKTALPGFSILCFPDCPWVSRFLRWISDRSRARSAFSAEGFAARALAGALVLSKHAGHTGPFGIGRLRLFPERSHGTHHPGVVEHSKANNSAVFPLFCLHFKHHFCYSLSSISLYDRCCRGGGGGCVSTNSRSFRVSTAQNKRG